MNLGHPGIQQLYIDGDIILGGLFPVHKKSRFTESACGEIDVQPGFQYLTAMLFALEKINKNPELLPNITLGTMIYDTCRSPTIGADRAKDIIKFTVLDATKPVAGVVGPLTSDVTIVVANLLRVFDIPQVSYGATTVDLSNKELYGNFFRTVPPDSLQAKALVDVILHYGWNYVYTINSHGNYGQRGMEIFHNEARISGICIAREFRLKSLPGEENYRNVIESMINHGNSKAHVVVLFTTQTDAAGLLRAAKGLDVKGFTWLGSNGWSDRVDVIEGKEDIANGSLTVGHQEGIVKGFLDFLTNLNSSLPPFKVENQSQNTWFDEFAQSILKCKISDEGSGANSSQKRNCDRHGSLLRMRIMELAPVRVVVNAVYSIAYALNNVHKDNCPGQIGICKGMKIKIQEGYFLDYLKNVTFPDSAFNSSLQFNAKQEINGNYSIINFQQGKDGKWRYVVVGSWEACPRGTARKRKELQLDDNRVSWGNTMNIPPLSYCSDPCAPNQIRKHNAVNKQCCWQCKHCKTGRIIRNNTCIKCRLGYTPDASLSFCSKIDLLYPKWSNPLSTSLAVIAGTLVLVALLTSAFYFQKRNHRVIKAAGRELCFLMFIGVILCFISSLMQLVKASNVVCAFRRYLGCSCFTWCYAPLLIKTNRIYRIFTHAQHSAARPPLIRPLSQVFTALGLVLVQLLITTVWTISDEPRAIVQYSSSDEALLVCSSSPVAIAVNMSYNMLLLSLCTVFAFKTRNFPRNFNEAKQIGMTMYMTCSIWIIYFPTFLNTRTAAWRDFTNCFMFLIIGCVNLFGLLIPKVAIFVMGKVSVETPLVRTESSHERHCLHIMDSGRETVPVILELEATPPKKRTDNAVDSPQLSYVDTLA